jgi:hypothetical protein
MCRADLKKRDLRRVKLILGLLGVAVVTLILVRTNALNYAIDGVSGLGARLSRKVDTATSLPQDTFVPTVIGPGSMNANRSVSETPPAPQPSPSAAGSNAQPTTAQQTPAPVAAATTTTTSPTAAGSPSFAALSPDEHLADASNIAQMKPEPPPDMLSKAVAHLKAVPPTAPQYAESQALLKRLERQLARTRPATPVPPKGPRLKSNRQAKPARAN